LTSKGYLNWNVGNDLCGAIGIVCDNSSPYQRAMYLYFFIFIVFFKKNKFFFDKFWGVIENIDRLLEMLLKEQLVQCLGVYQTYKFCYNFFQFFYWNQNWKKKKGILIIIDWLGQFQHNLETWQICEICEPFLSFLTKFFKISLNSQIHLNQLSGTIPTELGNLSNVQTM